MLYEGIFGCLMFGFLLRLVRRLLSPIDKGVTSDVIRKKWLVDGILHREDGPAIEWADGTKWWYLNGILHREDGPAIECGNGDQYWYLNGQLHREGLPAMICSNGSEHWYLNGSLHREGAPAVKNKDGSENWYLNGQLHREDGPAMISSSGTGVYYRNGRLHREDGPALVSCTGDEHWYLNGQLHREDGPAIQLKGGGGFFYRNGVRFFPEKEITEPPFSDSFEKAKSIEIDWNCDSEPELFSPSPINDRFAELPVYPQDYWKPQKTEKTLIYILPSKPNGSDWSVIRKQHYINVKGEQKTVQCPRELKGQEWEGTCPLCDLYKRYWAFNGHYENQNYDRKKSELYREFAKSIKPQPRHYAQVLVMEDGAIKGPFLWSMSEVTFHSVKKVVEDFGRTIFVSAKPVHYFTHIDAFPAARRNGSFGDEQEIVRREVWDLEKVVSGWKKPDEEMVAVVEAIEVAQPSNPCQQCHKNMPKESPSRRFCSEECLEKNLSRFQMGDPEYCPTCGTKEDDPFDKNIRVCGFVYAHPDQRPSQKCSTRTDCKCKLNLLYYSRGCMCDAPSELVAKEYYEKTTGTCDTCKDTFLKSNHKQRYCSEKCHQRSTDFLKCPKCGERETIHDGGDHKYKCGYFEKSFSRDRCSSLPDCKCETQCSCKSLLVGSKTEGQG